MKQRVCMPSVMVACCLLTGCVTGLRPSGVRLEQVDRLTGFSVPECVFADPATGVLYISNIEAGKDQYWTDDGKGSVTRIEADGTVRHGWANSSPRAVINGPKGMCLLKGKLYIADNTRLLCCDAAAGGDTSVVADGFGKANDVATDGANLWVSDTQEGKAWCVAPDGSTRREVPCPESVNGLTFHGRRLFAVSWGLHDVYELDPTGASQPRAFGLADHFVNLDSIEVLADGTFIVSDFIGGTICSISPDRSTVRVLARVASPADIGLDRGRRLLYVPLFQEDEVVVFSIK